MIRGLGAALALAFTLNAAPVCAAVLGQAALPPGETTLPSGLTLALRRIATAPVGAIAVWIKSPADGYDGRRPGLARVSAYALAAQKLGGGSLRDRVRAEGGSINISVFPMATELAVVVPSYAAPSVADALLRRALHPVIDAGAFREAKTAAAADMTIAGTIPDIAFRDALFAQAFPAGPLHESTYGDPRALGAITLSDVRRFSARAYAPPNEMVAAVGAIDPAGVLDRLSALAEPAQGGTPIPASGHAPRAAAGVAQRAPDLPGIGLAWLGPPIADEPAATAMDFISDYLTRPGSGTLAKALTSDAAAASGTAFSGQFVTLRDAGLFYVCVSGPQADNEGASAALTHAVRGIAERPLPEADFAQAVGAFRTHLLRDEQTAAAIADNYGWYFVQGSAAYSPSAVDEDLGGDYFARVAELTPQLVYHTAQRYLAGPPIVVVGSIGKPGHAASAGKRADRESH